MSAALFERDGDLVVPTEMARGPWDPGACHGGAPAALLTALLDAQPAPVPMQLTRLTFDLLRPVPLAPLQVRTETVRDGRRVQLLEASVRGVDGTELVRCRALRLRTGSVELPASAVVEADTPITGPDELPRLQPGGVWADAGFWQAVDVRMVEGELGEPGPGTAWFSLEMPLLEDLEVTPAARAAAAADFGNGIGSPLPMGSYRYVNPDLTLHLDRLPEGPWVGVRARSVAQVTGVGLTRSEVFDLGGRIGLAAQSLYVDAAPDAG